MTETKSIMEQLAEATTVEDKIAVIEEFVTLQETEKKKNEYRNKVQEIRQKKSEALKTQFKSYFDSKTDLNSIIANVNNNIDKGHFDLVDDFINKEE